MNCITHRRITQTPQDGENKMKAGWFRIVCLVLITASALHATAQDVHIDATQTGAPISAYIYGQFIEHMGRSIYGGIWAEMLEDRKFLFPITGDRPGWEELKPGEADWQGSGVPYTTLSASPWQIIGPKQSVSMATDNPYVGKHDAVVAAPTGIVHPRLALVPGKDYTGRVVMTVSPGVEAVELALAWGDGPDTRDTVVIRDFHTGFAKYPFTLSSKGRTDDGRFSISVKGTGAARIGAVSLMPADNVKGFRPDVLALLKELDAPIYRWPGGNFVSGYDWRDGLGDPDQRPSRKNPAWTGIETNDVGIDEFIQLCRLIDTEPLICVNTGFGDAHSAAQEVEYCNGTTDTPMGKWRAHNGNPKPYGIVWWAVGNEMFGSWQLGHMILDHYVLKHNQVEEKMRQIDPNIKTIASGQIGDWSKGMFKHCSNHMDLISEHFYCGENNQNVSAHVRQVPETIRKVADAHREYRKTIPELHGKTIPIAMDEWNYWYGGYAYGELGTVYHLKDALGIAAGLHEYFRNSDIIFMANYAQTVNVLGAIKTTPTHAFMSTTGQALKLYRQAYGEIPVAVEHEDRELDIAAAWTKNRKVLTIGVVNPQGRARTVNLDIKGATPTGKGAIFTIADDDPMAFNDAEHPDRVGIRESALAAFDGTLHIPPYSITLYRLKCSTSRS